MQVSSALSLGSQFNVTLFAFVQAPTSVATAVNDRHLTRPRLSQGDAMEHSTHIGQSAKDVPKKPEKSERGGVNALRRLPLDVATLWRLVQRGSRQEALFRQRLLLQSTSSGRRHTMDSRHQMCATHKMSSSMMCWSIVRRFWSSFPITFVLAEDRSNERQPRRNHPGWRRHAWRQCSRSHSQKTRVQTNTCQSMRQ